MHSGAFNTLTDPSQNYIDRYPHPLDPLFHPHTIAVVGAKDDQGSVARTLMLNLMAGPFKGKIYPVNPKRDQVLGIRCYPSLSMIPEDIDLAVLVTPAPTIPALVAECVAVKVKTVIIISAGFKELGEPGQKLEEEILRYAKQGHLPIIGPNCLGMMNPIFGLNATFAKGSALPGHLAFMSQSGAMCTAVLDWSLQKKVGFSAFISIGSMIDVNWGDLISYFGEDPHTHSLLLYMETIGDARSFMTAAREVALEKPIIVIKAGRSQEAARASLSHTGSLAGSDEVFDTAIERAGVLRVKTISELFNMASILSKQPRPKGPYLTILSNAGGPAVLATDALVLNKGRLAPLAPATLDSLNEGLPAAWSHHNPVDILGDADAARYAKAMEILVKESSSEGLLVILSPQDMTDPTATAEEIVKVAKNYPKALLASWMGGKSVRKGIEILSNAHIPVFEYPDEAAQTFATMWRYHQNLQSLYEMPSLSREKNEEKGKEKNNTALLPKIFEKAKKEGRTLLDERESKEILEDYQIPVVKTMHAFHIEEALALAEKMGFPCVLKIFSRTITHKTEVGGVKLNLKNAKEVRQAFEEIRLAVEEKQGKESFEGVTVQRMVKLQGYELILGSSTDPQFGPVLLFGLGGQLVEVFKDHALAIPPLNINLTRQMMKKTKIYEALLGVRGKPPILMAQLEEIIIRFSKFIVENPRIKECDINPLLVSDKEIIALDARILLHDFDLSDAQLPSAAIRPYPFNYVWTIPLKKGMSVLLRPILPEDEILLIEFHRHLSEDSIRQRFFEFMSLDARVTHERLLRICFNDYDREWALVAEWKGNSSRQIVGVGRLIRTPGTKRAQFKLTIIDSFHGLGLGTQLLQHLLHIAIEEKIQKVDGYILSQNQGMLKICERLGFILCPEKKNPMIIHAEWRNK